MCNLNILECHRTVYDLLALNNPPEIFNWLIPKFFQHSFLLALCLKCFSWKILACFRRRFLLVTLPYWLDYKNEVQIHAYWIVCLIFIYTPYAPQKFYQFYHMLLDIDLSIFLEKLCYL